MKRQAEAAFRRILMRIYYDTRLKYKLIVAYSTFILVPILFIGLTSYYSYRGHVIDTEKKSIEQSMTQLNNSMENFLEIYFNKSQMLFNNLQLQKNLNKINNNIDDIAQTYRAIQDITDQTINDVKYPYLKNSYYFGGNIQLKIYTKNATLPPDGKNILPFEEIQNESWNSQLQHSDTMFNWQGKTSEKDGKLYIVLNRKLINFKDFNDDLGVIRLFIPIERLLNLIEKNTKNVNYELLYMDNESNVIAGFGPLISRNDEFVRQVKKIAPQKGVNEITIGRARYLAGFINSEITGWKWIYLTPVNVLTDKVKGITYLTLATIIGSILLCILIATVISSYVTRRINILVRKTNAVKNGSLNIDDKIMGNDEIGQLDKNFNSMVRRIANLIEVEYKSKIVLNQTKLELLQQQINPHLYYNSLAMIGSIAKKTNQPDILHVANNLIAFYKGILNRGSMISSLNAEVNMTRSYIEIMKFVYSLNIDAIFEIEDRILDCYSIKLFLQPIVENAVLHGIKPLKSGTIAVIGKMLEDRIEFTVSDNGVGMEPEFMEAFRSGLDNSHGEKGYGLGNVIKRIHLFFGEPYGLRVESTPGMGTNIVISIPIFSEKEIIQSLQSKYLY